MKQKIKYHTFVSFIKSAVRIMGFITLLFNIKLGAIILIVAEIIGILEEKEEL